MDLTLFAADPTALALLAERARLLATTDMATATVRGAIVVTFTLDDACYGVPATAVREVHVLASYRSLPAVPAFILGLVNVRGQLLTLLDLRPLLKLPGAAPRPDSAFIIIHAGSADMALYADAVLEVRTTDLELLPPLRTSHTQGLAWIAGLDSQMTLILDPALLLSDGRLIVDEAAE
jgi:purine-binding chemotaxis protein CheW